VLSPGTRRRDRGAKPDDYRSAGVPHIWLIEPESPVTVEEHALAEDGSYGVRVETAPAAWEPVAMPGWSLSLEALDAAVSAV
jgi:Uma2 family endonuclease